MPRSCILIYRIGSLGDTIISLPAFNRIKELHVNDKIVLLTNKPVVTKAAGAELVLGLGYFYEKVLNYPYNSRNPFALLKILLNIRLLGVKKLYYLAHGRTPDLVKRDLLFFKLAGVRNFDAVPEAKCDFELCIDNENGEYEWEAKRIARRLFKHGYFDVNLDQYWDLHLTKSEIEIGQSYLKMWNHDNVNICISPGTKMQSKNWGIENWKNLVSVLSNNYPKANIIIIGALEERALADDIGKSSQNAILNLCGKTLPRESSAVLQKCDIFIGQDSGPMHLAGAVGVPCVAIFSSRNLPGQWFPRGANNHIIYHKVECAGCHLETCIEQAKKCILSISVNEVMLAVDNILAKKYNS